MRILKSSELSARNTFAFAGFDRRSEWRNDPARMQSVEHVGLELFVNEQSLVSGAEQSLHFMRCALAPNLPRWYLGEAEQQHYFARAVAGQETIDLALEWFDVRAMALQLSPLHAGLAAYARGLHFWHQRHQYCGVCAAATRSVDAGHKRVCTNLDCATEHFPRTDPAIIVAVEYQQKILLGRQATWPLARYSTLAGFVEPGESLEEAVIREVFEEAGVRVQSCDYFSSQPWPFPSSLMLGFHAQAADDRVQVNDELEDARYFSCAEFECGLADGSLRIPPAVSVSYRLIEAWYEKTSGRLLPELLTQIESKRKPA
jgi:NAD+ diphosphatase